jgi:hypothetical protein
VDIGENHIVGAARRWAVALDAGGLVFVDSDQLIADSFSCRGLPTVRNHICDDCNPATTVISGPKQALRSTQIDKWARLGMGGEG